MLSHAVASLLALATRLVLPLLTLLRWIGVVLRGPGAIAAERQRLRRRRDAIARLRSALGWSARDVPVTDGWAGSPELLATLAELVLAARPQLVVEFGSGASTIVLARALALVGEAGRLVSYDHHAGFAEQTRRRLAAAGLCAEVRAVELLPSDGYPGRWYAPDGLPDAIDMVVIDGPPAWLAAGTRGGAAPVVFPRLREGGIVLLDDSSREGEQGNLRRWREDFPEIVFETIESEKGMALGRKTMRIRAAAE